MRLVNSGYNENDMITTALLYILYRGILIVIAPLLILNDVSLDGNFSNSIQTANTYISPIDSVFPVGTLLTILGIFILFEIYLFTYRSIMWAIKKIPTIN